MTETRDRAAKGATREQGRILAATILGSSMGFIDSSVVNVALPSVQSSLAAGIDVVQWVVNAYLLFLSALVLLGGALGDRYGRVRVFMAGILLFAAASMACAFAPSAPVLIASRALQGIGAALTVPSSLAIIEAAFDSSQRGQAIGTWSGASALATAFGPPLGGWLVDAISWRAIFFINLPIALAALWLARSIPESRDPEAPSRLDWRGATLMAGGLGAVSYGFISAPKSGFSDGTVLASIPAGIALLAGFVFAEARSPAPMMRLALFRSRLFSSMNLVTLLLYFALSGVLFYLPYTLIRGHGYSATEAGSAFLPLLLLLGVLSRQAGKVSARLGARPMLITGPLLAAAGLGLLASMIDRGSYWSAIFPGMLLLGIGLTLVVAPLTTTVMGAVSVEHAGVASGINNAVARIAGLLAVAILGLLFLGLDDGSANTAVDAKAAFAGFRAVAIAASGCAVLSALVAAVAMRR